MGTRVAIVDEKWHLGHKFVLVCTVNAENQGWRTLKCHVRMENGALVRATCTKQPEIAKLPRNALAQTRMKIAHWRCKNGRQKETCDANGEIACGYCGSKCMLLNQKVMERMYKTA
jgi:DNA-directed RNA polymerase subunit RPC12/RpoP